MSRVEGCFGVCSYGADALGVSAGADDDSVLVTLPKEGVLEYRVSTQTLVRSWVLGGSSARHLTAKAVCVDQPEAGAPPFMAAIVQERKGKHILSWDRTCQNLNKCKKTPLGKACRIVVVPLDRTMRKHPCLLVLAFDGTFWTFTDKGGLSEGTRPANLNPDAEVLDVRSFKASDGALLVCYRQRLGNIEELSLYRLANDPTDGEDVEREDISAANLEEVVRWKVAVGGAICGSSGDGVLILNNDGTLDAYSASSGKTTLCRLTDVWNTSKGGIVAAGVASHQLALAGAWRVGGEGGGSDELGIALVDGRNGSPYLVYAGRDEDKTVGANEYVVEAVPLDEESLLVMTSRNLHCVKLRVAEVAFEDMLGSLSATSPARRLFHPPARAAGSQIASVSKEKIAGPAGKSSQCYQVLEAVDAHSFVDVPEDSEQGFETWVASHVAGTPQELYASIKALAQDETKLRGMTDAFHAKLWRRCVDLRCWKGMKLLASQNAVAIASDVMHVLLSLIEHDQAGIFIATIKQIASLTESELERLLTKALMPSSNSNKEASANANANANANGNASVYCMHLLSKSASVESLTKTLARLDLPVVVRLLNVMRGLLESLCGLGADSKHPGASTGAGVEGKAGVGGGGGGGGQGHHEPGSLDRAIVYTSCTLDAHMGALLLSEETHPVIEELTRIVRARAREERERGRLKTMLTDLKKMEPVEAAALPHANDLTIELLNIQVTDA